MLEGEALQSVNPVASMLRALAVEGFSSNDKNLSIMSTTLETPNSVYYKTHYTSLLKLFTAREVKTSDGTFHIFGRGKQNPTFIFTVSANRFKYVGGVNADLSPEAILDLGRFGQDLRDKFGS